MLVKICGLTRTADAELAESLGADFLGVIMAGGPRHLSMAEAAAVLGKRRPNVRRVVVFGNQSVEDIADIATALDLDVVQLHGDVSPELVQAAVHWLQERVDAWVWPVLRIAGTQLPPNVSALAREAKAVLLDAKVVGHLGGTGVTLNWAELRADVARLRAEVPEVSVVLAGGLRPGNVQNARDLLSPDVVDVSSGVEVSPGIKDAEKLVQFMAAAGAGNVRNNTGTE